MRFKRINSNSSYHKIYNGLNNHKKTRRLIYRLHINLNKLYDLKSKLNNFNNLFIILLSNLSLKYLIINIKILFKLKHCFIIENMLFIKKE